MKIIKRVLSICGYISVAVGALFKILHWPFAIPLIIGGLILYFISVVLSFVKRNSEISDSNPNILDDI